MSKRHPVIVVTGSSGAGTTTVKTTFDTIFRREGVRAAVIEGDAFHRYTRSEMKLAMAQAERENRHLSHFSPDANEWQELAQQFRAYGETGRCRLPHTLLPAQRGRGRALWSGARHLHRLGGHPRGH